jgi:hypothetical protein
VVDSEFSELQSNIQTATDVQAVSLAHRNFLAMLSRLAMLDNMTIQEGIERILHLCLRFVAVCRILHQQEEDIYTNACQGYEPDQVNTSDDIFSSDLHYHLLRPKPILVPTEELDGIYKEFFAQITYFFHLLRNVECRGLLFRLDFNGYFSDLTNDHPSNNVSMKANIV